MDWQLFFSTFGVIFLAEMGDKTQLATMLFATDKEVSKYLVFAAASAALVVASALGVLAGLTDDFIDSIEVFRQSNARPPTVLLLPKQTSSPPTSVFGQSTRSGM